MGDLFRLTGPGACQHRHTVATGIAIACVKREGLATVAERVGPLGIWIRLVAEGPARVIGEGRPFDRRAELDLAFGRIIHVEEQTLSSGIMEHPAD